MTLETTRDQTKQSKQEIVSSGQIWFHLDLRGGRGKCRSTFLEKEGEMLINLRSYVKIKIKYKMLPSVPGRQRAQIVTPAHQGSLLSK